jgi:ABC-2 type transport system permease protein
VNALRKMVGVELKLTLRDGPVSLVSIAFPLGVVVIFGLIADPAHNSDSIIYYFPSMALAMGLGVLSFSLMPTQLATYREKGILRRMATTPVHPSRLLGAQLVVNLLVVLAAIVLVVTVGRLGVGFPLPKQPIGFALTALIGGVALLAIGLFIAAVAPSARVATGIGVAFYFVNLALGGVFVPKEVLPPTLARIGDFMPVGALLQALRDSWAGQWPHLVNLLVLLLIIPTFGLAALRLFRWE